MGDLQNEVRITFGDVNIANDHLLAGQQFRKGRRLENTDAPDFVIEDYAVIVQEQLPNSVVRFKDSEKNLYICLNDRVGICKEGHHFTGDTSPTVV